MVRHGLLRLACGRKMAALLKKGQLKSCWEPHCNKPLNYALTVLLFSCSEVFDQVLSEEEGSEAKHSKAAGVHLNIVHALEVKGVWV